MGKRNSIIIANWKMHKTRPEAIHFFNELKQKIGLIEPSKRVLIAPPFLSIPDLALAAQGTPFIIGAQNMHQADEGPFTGEVSADMLKEVGAGFVLIGHSERRQWFNETDTLVALKLERAIAKSLDPILCIGETLEERRSGNTHQILSRQLRTSLNKLSKIDSFTLAYEPLWAIGTNNPATPQMIEETHLFCRQILSTICGTKEAEDIPILYGGSVEPQMIPTLLPYPNIDGVLVGSASLQISKFIQIIKLFSRS